MRDRQRYFFCGIGGSGMLPLAMILQGQGAEVSGSDRSRDQGRTPEKFRWLEAQGIALFPQDGSGLTSPDQTLVASAAVEDTVPDVAAALRLGCNRVTRAEALADLFNAAPSSIGVAGTSGKSTTTAMIAWILDQASQKPTVMNGAVMKNFANPDRPFASALAGETGSPFVSEIDESDGSIALFNPEVAVLNNVSVDHKSMEELRALFGNFLARSDTAVINADDPETRALGARAAEQFDYGIEREGVFMSAGNLVPAPVSISFELHWEGYQTAVKLSVPGRHNVSNALAAICAARAVGVGVVEAAKALETFSGIKRRFEIVGEAGGVTVIDDFGHNPDKIAATLSTLHDFQGRVLVMFQPHGFGPLRKMRTEFAESFVRHLSSDDVLVMPEPVYFGGTVSREVSSVDLANDIRKRGRQAEAFEDRAACGERLLELARPGDRLIIMGARDDTLSEFAVEILERLRGREFKE
ncbi:MAG: Mur ligase family protein [Pseudomonadota bacterium]